MSPLSCCWLLLVPAALAVCGCRETDSVHLVPVTGRVLVDGQPLHVGTVSLRPADGNETQHHPTGAIDSAGNYRVFTIGREGAPPGKYKVLVFADGNTSPQTRKVAHPAMPAWLVHQRYTEIESTDLELEIVETETPKVYDLRLKK